MSNETNILEGTEEVNNSVKHTQVYYATHDGEGKTLPFMNRSFISFSYGGKNIEDFNLIATVSGDRWQANGYANFNDLTTSYDVLDGQFFWGSHYSTYELSLELSTDGITQEELDNFLHWFTPGQYKELILAEHPNRARLARVSAVPALSMLPFEKKIDVQIGGSTYSTSTTEYKGSISLTLVGDDPFWYAKASVFGKLSNSDSQKTQWFNAIGNEVYPLKDKDALKVIHEDRIPLSSMVKADMILGDGFMVKPAQEPAATNLIFKKFEQSQGSGNGYYEIKDVDAGKTYYYKGATTNLGQIASPVMVSTDSSSESVELAAGDPLYLYYSGTAPGPLKIKFELPITFNDKGYISCIANNYDLATNDKPYNTITLQGEQKQEFHLTVPNIFSSYNAVIYNLNTYTGKSGVELEELMRDCIHHAGVRAYIIHLLEATTGSSNTNTETNTPTTETNDNTEETTSSENSNDQAETPNVVEEPYQASTITENMINDMIVNMKKFFEIITDTPDPQNLYYSQTFEFDSKTGEATGTFTYNLPPKNNSSENNASENNHITTEENIQDMILSKNLFIRERNTFAVDNGNLVVQAWEENNPKYSHKLFHDFSSAWQNVVISYQNLYL